VPHGLLIIVRMTRSGSIVLPVSGSVSSTYSGFLVRRVDNLPTSSSRVEEREAEEGAEVPESRSWVGFLERGGGLDSCGCKPLPLPSMPEVLVGAEEPLRPANFTAGGFFGAGCLLLVVLALPLVTIGATVPDGGLAENLDGSGVRGDDLRVGSGPSLSSMTGLARVLRCPGVVVAISVPARYSQTPKFRL
jgi:hypothetical protein